MYGGASSNPWSEVGVLGLLTLLMNAMARGVFSMPVALRSGFGDRARRKKIVFLVIQTCM